MDETPVLEHQEAFPDEPLQDLAHDLVGTLLIDVVDRGHSLPAARRLLLAAFASLIENCECCETQRWASPRETAGECKRANSPLP